MNFKDVKSIIKTVDEVLVKKNYTYALKGRNKKEDKQVVISNEHNSTVLEYTTDGELFFRRVNIGKRTLVNNKLFTNMRLYINHHEFKKFLYIFLIESFDDMKVIEGLSDDLAKISKNDVKKSVKVQELHSKITRLLWKQKFSVSRRWSVNAKDFKKTIAHDIEEETNIRILFKKYDVEPSVKEIQGKMK